MRIKLPEAVRWIIGELQGHGYEAYAVGGCVRDSILCKEPKDWDITTSARPEQVKEIFERTIDTGIRHGTVTVLQNHVGYEVTTYRIDGEYEDARHPKEVVYTTDVRRDLMRRDFTINAMAYNERSGLVDEFGGVSDLKRGVIRCVGNASERFAEDALRMFRAVRFAAQLDFEIENETAEAICCLAENLRKISAERIQMELTKLLMSPHPQKLRLLYELGLSAVVLPEFDVMMETRQNNPHHCDTVGGHTIRALMEVPADKILRYTMLLHDVAKPQCCSVDEAGICHFYGHPEEGEKIAKRILRRLKLDNATTDAVCRLVRYHDSNPVLTAGGVRRAVYRIGQDCFPALFDVKRADILAQSDYKRLEKLEALDCYRRLYGEIMDRKECLSLKELAVSGSDFIAAGIKPGPEIGRALHALLEIVIEEPEKNTKEYLMRYTLENLFI